MGKFSKAGGREMPELNTFHEEQPDLVFDFLVLHLMVKLWRKR